MRVYQVEPSLLNLTMEQGEAFKHGHLSSPPQAKILKRNWQKKYYALYTASNFGVNRLEVFDSDDQYCRRNPSKIIPLNDCIKVVHSPQRTQQNVFEVITKSQSHQYSAETTQELTEWISAFQIVAFGDQRGRTTSASCLTLNSYPSCELLSSPEIGQLEENMLYCSLASPEVYSVKVIETDTSRRCYLQGAYHLILTSSSISVARAEDGRNYSGGPVTLTWLYRHIRRYGHSKESFSFEAGRKCMSGEGLFLFETKDGNTIFQSVGDHVKVMKKGEESGELGATSPVYPNPSTKTLTLYTNDRGLIFSVNSAFSNSSLSPPPPEALELPNRVPYLSGSGTSTPASSFSSVSSHGSAPALKTRPEIAKPPRKHKPVPDAHNNSTTVDNRELPTSPTLSASSTRSQQPALPNRPGEQTYSELERRVDAWKKFGEGEIYHKENEDTLASGTSHGSGALYASTDVAFKVPTRPQPPTDIPIKLIDPFVIVPPPTINTCESSYDHLNPFGFSPRTNSPQINESKHVYGKLNKIIISTTNSAPNSPAIQDKPFSPKSPDTGFNRNLKSSSDKPLSVMESVPHNKNKRNSYANISADFFDLPPTEEGARQ